MPKPKMPARRSAGKGYLIGGGPVATAPDGKLLQIPKAVSCEKQPDGTYVIVYHADVVKL